MTKKKSEDQKAFEKISKHLLKQGEASILSNWGDCVYRGKNGLRCAAGVIITDKEYLPAMEGWTYDRVKNRFNLPHKYNEKMIVSLQKLHDKHTNWKRDVDGQLNRIIDGLKRIGKRFKLEVAFLDKITGEQYEHEAKT